MDKGIRAYARTHFVEQNALRVAGTHYTGPKGNTEFRKAVMCKLMEEFGCSLASAATHYNEALKAAREANPQSVEGLGRPEDKKGGRKPKAKPEVEQESTLVCLLESSILEGATPRLMAEMEEALM